MPESNDAEVQALSDYGYDLGYKIAQILAFAGQAIILGSFLVLNRVARHKVKRPEIQSLLDLVPQQLRSFVSARWLVSFLALPLIYWLNWVLWLRVPEDAQDGWFYEHVGMALGLFYAIFSAFWLQSLHQHWLVSKNRPEASLDRSKLLSVIAIVGFDKVSSTLYDVFSLFYAPIAVRCSLSLAFVFSGKQGMGSALRSSLKRSKGHFWESARLFSSTGFTAYATLLLHRHLDAVDFASSVGNIYLLALIYAALDAIAASIWIITDSIILLRGLEYLELPDDAEAAALEQKAAA